MAAVLHSCDAQELGGVADAAGWAMLVITCPVVLLKLADPRNAWVHPELVGLATYMKSTRVDHPFLSVFDWPIFYSNSSRLRFLSELGQGLDAFLMKALSIKISAINLSTLILVLVAPWAFFKTLRLWRLPRYAALAQGQPSRFVCSFSV